MDNSVWIKRMGITNLGDVYDNLNSILSRNAFLSEFEEKVIHTPLGNRNWVLILSSDTLKTYKNEIFQIFVKNVRKLEWPHVRHLIDLKIDGVFDEKDFRRLYLISKNIIDDKEFMKFLTKNVGKWWRLKNFILRKK